MSLVVFSDVSLHLGGRPIVEGLSLRVGEKDRIGLVGPNGSGKTTLLRLIAREQIPDGGAVHRAKTMRLGYLPQDVHVEGGKPLLAFILDSIPGRASLDEDLATAEADLEALSAAGDHSEAAQELMLEAAGRIADLHERVAHFDGEYSEHHAKRIMAGLGFKDSDHVRDMSEFSGGWKMRAVLSSLLFQQPDLLLLDEPTNHLDMPSVAWFSGFLKRYERAFVLISHDREFLNEQITTVVSYEPEGVRSYTGDYNAYKRQRDEERVLLENRARNLEREREHLEKFVDRFRSKATKAAQVQSRVKKLEKMDTVELQGEHVSMSFRFPPTERSGKVALETKDLGKSYGGLEVLKGVNQHVQRGERVALLGVNGAGKTTLLRMLAGELEATAGSFEFGHNTKIGYYAQHHAETLRRDATVYEEVKYCAKDAPHQQIRSVLGAMLFGEREVDKRIGVLSGGERARVALAQLMINPGNVLLMDEPTNHLDLVSSERLAEALDTFDGTLLFVSHNRGFIRSLATTIWIVEGGNVLKYPGSFDEYMASCLQRDQAPVAVSGAPVPEKKAPGNSTPSKAPVKVPVQAMPATNGKRPQEPARTAAPAAEPDKGRRREDQNDRKRRTAALRPLEKRAAELEKRVAELEQKLEAVNAELSTPEVYGDATRRDTLLGSVTRVQAELEVAMETWSEVQEQLEAERKKVEAG
ncbi:MAG: ATP-binding cassette domain-containing protein [Deltaproteobacteria bacterium]|nr:ATP-binding cassette domain-containing protein [Deltaproteobacteria bacterium]